VSLSTCSGHDPILVVFLESSTAQLIVSPSGVEGGHTVLARGSGSGSGKGLRINSEPRSTGERNVVVKTSRNNLLCLCGGTSCLLNSDGLCDVLGDYFKFNICPHLDSARMSSKYLRLV